MPHHGGEDAVVPGLSSAGPPAESGGVGPRPEDRPPPESMRRSCLGSHSASPPPRGLSGPRPRRGPPDPGDRATCESSLKPRIGEVRILNYYSDKQAGLPSLRQKPALWRQAPVPPNMDKLHQSVSSGLATVSRLPVGRQGSGEVHSPSARERSSPGTRVPGRPGALRTGSRPEARCR